MSFTDKIQLRDEYGFEVECTPMDELRTVTPVRLVGTTFAPGATLDSSFWTDGSINAGTVVQGNNKVILNCNTNIAGSALLTSVRTARYVGASSNRYRAQVVLGDTGVASNIRKWGVRSGTTDGAYFRLNGTGMEIVTLKTSVETAVASASWNKSTTVPTLTDCNTYEVYYTNKSVYFTINGTLVHTVTSADTWADTLHFQAFASNVNTGNTVNKTLTIRTSTISRLGNLETLTTYKNITTGPTSTVCKLGPGTLHRIVVNNPANNITIDIYDNTTNTGTLIGSINNNTSAVPYVLEYHVPFNTGLTINTSGAINITVIYE